MLLIAVFNHIPRMEPQQEFRLKLGTEPDYFILTSLSESHDKALLELLNAQLVADLVFEDFQ